MSNWQPIETAPKDGTKILGYDPELHGVCIAEWAEYYNWYVDRASQDGFGYSETLLTHWMPLPDGPKDV